MSKTIFQTLFALIGAASLLIGLDALAIICALSIIGIELERVAEELRTTNALLVEGLILADPSLLDDACDGECENCMCGKFDKED